jgi:hypothetical protein
LTIWRQDQHAGKRNLRIDEGEQIWCDERSLDGMRAIDSRTKKRRFHRSPRLSKEPELGSGPEPGKSSSINGKLFEILQRGSRRK